MLPDSWFSITITKTCENDGTAGAGAGGGGSEWIGAADGFTAEREAAGVAGGAVGVGLASAIRLSCRGLNSGSLRSTATPVAATTAAVLAGLPPSSITVGMAINPAAPMAMIAPRAPGIRMTQLTRSGRPSCALDVA